MICTYCIIVWHGQQMSDYANLSAMAAERTMVSPAMVFLLKEGIHMGLGMDIGIDLGTATVLNSADLPGVVGG